MLLCRRGTQISPCTIGEPPKSVNENRYLVFLDGGGALYCSPSDLRKSATQPEPPSAWMKTYLENYPERAMVRLVPDQKVDFEVDREMLSTVVERVDCSMVLLKRGVWQDWVYRGDPR